MWFEIFEDGTVFLISGDKALDKWDTQMQVAKLQKVLDPSVAAKFSFAPKNKPKPSILVPDEPEEVAANSPGIAAIKSEIKWVASPNFSSRNGEKIKRIINHYTNVANVASTISWYQNPQSQVSAHYIVDKNGTIYQMVHDADKAWHAHGENNDSIGIEHVARPGEKLTPKQEQATIALHKWLMAEYGISLDKVTGHKFTEHNKGKTDCPHSIFGENSEQALRNWVKKNLA